MKIQPDSQKKASLSGIQNLFFRTQLILILTLAFMLGIAGTLINLHFETEKRDQNLQNVAEAIARSPFLTAEIPASAAGRDAFSAYLDTLQKALDNIDVISVVGKDGIRLYHSNHNLIETLYDGTMPDFESRPDGYYAVDETGPSGSQRRAYAAVYDESGDYRGFVMAITLMKNIKQEIFQLLLIFSLITVVAILIELILADKLSGKVKKQLMGYEPDVFTAMYKMRDNILETLDEGILAVDEDGTIQFLNDSALYMLCPDAQGHIVGQHIDVLGDNVLSHTMLRGGEASNVRLSNTDILLDRVPIVEENRIVGAIGILHDRAEYTKLMEDLSGTRYLVDSMRANNHDFTNKLHVILGLIQMEMYEEATSYIQNISIVQRENISRIMEAVDEPAVAALLIGKIARASELNVSFTLQDGSYYSPADLRLPAEMLVTVIGNLLDNAFDAMNDRADYHARKELAFGIYSHPGAVLITADDTGSGISPEALPHIFDLGYSTKGEGHGMGLHQVKNMVESYGGKITVESQEGIGSSFSVSFAKEAFVHV